MLDEATIAAIADDLAQAERTRSKIGLLTAKYPDMTVEDSYAVQNEWRRRGEAAGRRLYGHKIGLTSKPMQQATGITEPDYGAIFADQVYDTGAVIDHSQYSGVRIEVELAFVLRDELRGPDVSLFDVLRATEYVVPALEVLSSTPTSRWKAARSSTPSRTMRHWARWSSADVRSPSTPSTCAE